MADWGFLGGLGAGLSELGGTQFKNMLADKLEKGREERAQQRALKKVDPNLSGVTNDNGQFYYINRNVNGEELSRRPATDIEIAGAKMAEEELKGKRLGNIQTQFKVDTQEEEFRTDQEYKKELTQGARNTNSIWGALSPEERRQAALVKNDLAPGANAQLSARTSLAAATVRAGDSTTPTSSDFIDNFRGQFKDVIERYEQGGARALSPKETNDAIRTVRKLLEVRYASDPALAGKDPTLEEFRTRLEAELEARRRDKASEDETSTAGAVVLPKEK